MKVVIINGAPRSGKDTFVNLCKEKLGSFCYNFSTVDFVKEIAKQCGWDGEKTPNNRKFLSDLKDLLTDWNDVPYRNMTQELAKIYLMAEQYNLDHDKFVVFIHCREPEEIARFVKDYNATSLIIRRPEVEDAIQSNHADRRVFDYDYKVTIFNDDTIDRLKLSADFFLENLLKS